MSHYESNNIFAKILRGEIPCHKIYENDHSLALLDIMPRADGHTLIIPKATCRNLLDATPETLNALIQTTQNIAIAVQNAFNADGIMVEQRNEAAAGQEVFHLHFHVIPRHEGVELRERKMMGADVLEPIAERLRAILSS